MKLARGMFLMAVAAVLVISALPAMAEDTAEPSMVEEMVREMTRQGVPEEGALRLAHRSRFMAEMAAGTLEQEQRRLQDCDCESVGDQVPDRIRDRTQDCDPAGDCEPDRDRIREHAQDCPLDGTGDQLRQRTRARVGAAFGRALGAAYNHYGEEDCSQAALALFSATRRGLSPETGAATVQAFAENGYRLEEMYRFSMWMAERMSVGTQADEEALCDQIRQMTRQRLQVTAMTRQMEMACRNASGGDSSPGGPRAGQPEDRGTGQSGSGSSGHGGNSGGSDGNAGGNGGNNGGSGGGSGGKGHGH